MFRINVYISDEDLAFLRNLQQLTLSDHVRRALRKYVDSIKKETLNVSTSASKQKGVL